MVPMNTQIIHRVPPWDTVVCVCGALGCFMGINVYVCVLCVHIYRCVCMRVCVIYARVCELAYLSIFMTQGDS